MPGEHHSYLVTITEGAWNDWFLSVSVGDERGRKVAMAVEDRGPSLECVLSRLLTEAEEAIAKDFLSRRREPIWLEELRRSLICRLLWLKNLRYRIRQRGRDRKGEGTRSMRVVR